MRRSARLPVALVLTLALALGACKPSGTLTYDKNELAWGGGATEDEAKALGAFLREIAFFGPLTQARVKLDRDKELSHSAPTYRVTFVVPDGAWNDDSIVFHAQNMGDDMKRRVFHDVQTIVLLADGRGEEKKKLYAK